MLRKPNLMRRVGGTRELGIIPPVSMAGIAQWRTRVTMSANAWLEQLGEESGATAYCEATPWATPLEPVAPELLVYPFGR